MNKRIFLSPPHMSGAESDLVREAFASNYIAPVGPMVEAFERSFSRTVGIPHVLAVASGTAALHLALQALGIGPGDKVIAPSLTFIGGVSPIVYVGATPIFIDSHPGSWTLSPDLLEEELEFRNRKGSLPRAVISTDIYGQCADMDRILKTCQRYGLPLMSDSAEALGARYRERSAGCGAKAAVYSFNGNKIITTSGGGMVASGDPVIIQRARYLSQQARERVPHYEHTQIGYNYRLSNVLAAIGLGQLGVLEDRVQKRRSIFEYYQGTLQDLPGLSFMPEAPYGRSNRWLTVILISPEEFGADRETVRLALEERNIESRPVWKPMHLQPVFHGCAVRGGNVCEDLFNRGLCLPSGSAMTVDDLERVAGAIRGVAGGQASKNAPNRPAKSSRSIGPLQLDPKA
jgi:dTDP-4-amino-4,6-dideoxygalactose transaminase